MKIVLIIFLVLHGLIHVMGFAKAFELAELNQLKKTVSKNDCVVWLSAALLFMAR